MLRLKSTQQILILLFVFAIAWVLATPSRTLSQTEGDAPAAAEAQEPVPPADQHYLGVKQCASCHFDQFMKWKKTPHANTFELLTGNYQSDAKCLKCHTTGFGKPSGFTTAAATPDLKGTTCEECHGPGSKHADIAKQYANQKLTAEQEKEVRDSIWMMIPKNICVECHTVQAHHETQTPPALRKKK